MEEVFEVKEPLDRNFRNMDIKKLRSFISRIYDSNEFDVDRLISTLDKKINERHSSYYKHKDNTKCLRKYKKGR